jgi:anion-transporting  ArsA/GET3 family ATPase
MSWLIKPLVLANRFGLKKLINMGERLAQGLAKVTGVAALQILAELLVLMQEVIVGLNKTGQDVIETLQREDTAFVLITTLNSAPVRSACNIAEQLKIQDYRVKGVIVNRCLPQELQESIATFPENAGTLGASKFCLQSLYSSHQNSVKLKKTLIDRLKSLFGVSPYTKYFNERTGELHNLEALIFAAQDLDNSQ